MKPLHLYNQSTTWQRKVLIIAMYHNYQKNGWKISQTANYFHVSIGLVSENLKLFKNYDKVKDCATRKDALELIK